MIVTFIQKRENCGLVVINPSSDPKGVGSNPVEQWILLSNGEDKYCEETPCLKA